MLMADRYLGAHFFDTAAGGSVVMWMHFFWIFGHPEVYVLIIPCFAFRLGDHSGFSRKAMFGYPAMVAATVSIGFVSLGVWAHHMFTVGMPSYGNAFFVLTTMVVAVPTGIKIFNWLATMWGGKIHFTTPMLFRRRISVSVSDRRIDGHDARDRAIRLAARELLLRRGAFSLRDCGRNPVHNFRGVLLLVSENDRAGC